MDPKTNTQSQENDATDFDDAGHFGNVTNTEVHDDLELASLDLEQLKAEAAKRGVKLTNTTEKAAIIDEIIASGVAAPTRAEVGQLISIHTRDDAATALVRAIRNKQTENERAKKVYTIWLQNKEKVMYRMQGVTGCPLSKERTPEVLRILSPLPDGSQNALIKEFKEHPENFNTPLLVRLKRKNSRDDTSAWYVMLYLERKVDERKLVEQSF